MVFGFLWRLLKERLRQNYPKSMLTTGSIMEKTLVSNEPGQDEWVMSVFRVTEKASVL
jgi:hypothetical protein